MKASSILLILDSNNCNAIILHREEQEFYYLLPKIKKNIEEYTITLMNIDYLNFIYTFDESLRVKCALRNIVLFNSSRNFNAFLKPLVFNTPAINCLKH